MASYYETEAENLRQTADNCCQMHQDMPTSPVPGESYEAYYAAYREDIGDLCESYDDLAAKYAGAAQKYRALAQQLAN